MFQVESPLSCLQLQKLELTPLYGKGFRSLLSIFSPVLYDAQPPPCQQERGVALFIDEQICLSSGGKAEARLC